MGIAAAVLAGFFLGAAAPAIFRIARGLTGWLLAFLPAGLFAYFLSLLADLPAAGMSIGWPWVPSLGLNFSFQVDGLSLLFALLISGIGAIILVYAGAYLSGDPRLGRLYALLLMFMASMLGVVLADNLILMFVFWELTSLTSYLLIGFDHERAEARAAALQALLVTGGGGLALLAGVLLLGQVGAAQGLSSLDCFEFTSLATLGRGVVTHPLYFSILLLIVAGAFTKSAQFPFHFWLPSAMQAPTPVSAYLHSATMVKAGVYLLARMTPILGGTAEWQAIVGVAGGITLLVGAVLAMQESDLKRILAYTTVSALGMMVLLLGLGTPAALAAAVAFVLAHALYKGALFLVAGAVDHGTGTREVDRLGGLWRAMPVTAVAAVLSALSMAAIPATFGFIAKEMVLEATLADPWRNVATAAVVVGSMLFVALAMVLGLKPFFGRPPDKTIKPHAVAPSLYFGPLLLAAIGFTLGVAPHFADRSLLAAATAAILRTPQITPLKLAIWHGWSPALAWSAVSLVGGIALYGVRRQLRLPASVLQFGPARWYAACLAGLNSLARWQTRILQSGYLRYYLFTLLVTLVGLVATALFAGNWWHPYADWSGIRIHEAALVLLIILSIGATLYFQSMLSAIAALGCVGYSIALLFVYYGAPDLAATQFLIETLTVILFLFVFYYLPEHAAVSSPATRFRDGVLAVLVGCVMAGLVLLAVEVHVFPSIAAYYGEHSLADAHGRNVVNVILVDFRALDTLGEITVLAAAGLGVHSLIKLRAQGAGRS